MNEYLFKVADCYFSVKIPAEWSVARLLPSFRPFLHTASRPTEFLFRLEVHEHLDFPMEDASEVLEESTNDLGHVRVLQGADNLCIEVTYDAAHERKHWVQVNPAFTEGMATILYEDRTAGVALSSILRMMFAQTILRKQGISMHASCVCKDQKGYLFLGKSGTGKSTHSEQWMAAWNDCELLNDDNPIVRVKETGVWVYGSPWSGKKNCYKQKQVPVGGIVRLTQAPANAFKELHDTDAFLHLLPSCSVLRSDQDLQKVLYDNLVTIIESVPVGALACLPNQEAARLCHQQLSECTAIPI